MYCVNEMARGEDDYTIQTNVDIKDSRFLLLCNGGCQALGVHALPE